jgi:hypothetical protein
MVAGHDVHRAEHGGLVSGFFLDVAIRDGKAGGGASGVPMRVK